MNSIQAPIIMELSPISMEFSKQPQHPEIILPEMWELGQQLLQQIFLLDLIIQPFISMIVAQADDAMAYE